MTRPLIGSAFAAWPRPRPSCRWICNLCERGGVAVDPVAAIRAHLAEAHGTVTTTTVSTDVRDTIYRGTRWGR